MPYVWIVGALLWAGAACSVGYIVGAQRQFSRLPIVHVGQEIGFDSKVVSFVGWSAKEKAFRWAEDKETQIRFRPGQLDPKRPGDLDLTWTLARSLGRQSVTISLNGQKLGAFTANGGPGRFRFTVPRALLRPLAENILHAAHPGARRASKNDARKLAMALSSVRLAYKPSP